MYYCIVEKHVDNSWWYHGKSFALAESAEADFRQHFWWAMDREHRTLRMKKPLPNATLWTKDLKHFYDLNYKLRATIE